MYVVGDLIRIIDDPNSFWITEEIVGLTGIILAYDLYTEVYTILISGGTKKLKVLDFMMEKIENETKKDRKSARGSKKP